MQNLAWAIESEFSWTGLSTTTKDTWTEIWGDGAGAAVKDDTAIVFIFSLPLFLPLHILIIFGDKKNNILMIYRFPKIQLLFIEF